MGKNNKNKKNNQLTQKQLQTYQPKKNKFQQSEFQAQYNLDQKKQQKKQKSDQINQKRERSQSQKETTTKIEKQVSNNQQSKKVKSDKPKTINIIELKEGQKQKIIQNLKEFFTENLLIDILEESGEDSQIEDAKNLNLKPKKDEEEEEEDEDDEEVDQEEQQQNLQGFDQYNQEIDEKNIISYNDSPKEKCEKLIDFLLFSQNFELFQQHYFEKQPLLLKRNDLKYYQDLFSDLTVSEISNLINKIQKLEEGKHVLISEFKNSKLQKLNNNNNQKLTQNSFNQHLNQKHILEFQEPKLYIPTISYTTSLLEQQFNSVFSSKLTVAQQQSQEGDKQVFNQETFILQIEGSCKIKCYKPQDSSQQLPRFQEEIQIQNIDLSNPIANLTINAGDFIYLPRGVIYQKSYNLEQPKKESITLEFFFNQNKSTADFIDKFMPMLQTQHSQQDFQVRKSLPFNTFFNLGQQASEGNQIEQEDDIDNEGNDQNESNSELKQIKQGYNKQRRQIIEHLKQTLQNMINNQEAFEETIDHAADDLAIEFLQQRMLPLEIQLNQQIHPENPLASESENWEDYEIRFVTKNIGRIVSQPEETEEGKEPELDEEGKPFEDIVLYHCGRNAVDLENMSIKQSQPLIFPIEAAGALEQLFSCYPDFLAITDLQLEEEGDRLTVAQTLYDHNLILVRKMNEDF